ncbi:CLUMA_CG018508, isoform A [Clunio marinus]|uniref:CLUMA_CG018508, isoform A n=1 Tax=Clunio marinus TaxID=568069 RepID=A0A1J1J1B2_9DIPT|nr:CLUMA_CG018508, isoform A [Clunio marinus]
MGVDWRSKTWNIKSCIEMSFQKILDHPALAGVYPGSHPINIVAVIFCFGQSPYLPHMPSKLTMS